MRRIKLGFTAHVSNFISAALGTVIMPVFLACAQAQPTNLAVTVRHAPSLNGNGLIEGSLQQLLGENATLNGGFTMTGDLLVPGTPTLRVNGNPTFAGTIAGTGGTSPTGYQITLNGNCVLNHLRTRINPVSLPTVTAPPQPVGTRSVTINNTGQSIGNPATLRDLTLNGNVGQVTVPPGTYGIFNVNGGSGVVLGVAGGVQAVNYNLQNLNLNGNSTLKVVGPVVLTVANGFTANGTVGASNNPAGLQLQVASGGFTLNGGCTVYGLVLAPNGTVIVNGNSTLVGTSASDQFILNGNGLVRWGGSSTQTNPPPVATPQSIALAENSSTNITLTGSEPQGRTLTFTLLTLPSHGTVSGTPPSVTYKPATNYFGSDAFTFKVNNGITDSLPATVSLTVTQVYYPPIAFSQSLTNFEDTALPVTLTGYDPQGYALTFSVLTQPAHGTLSGTAPNLTYQPATNYFGNDSFTFRVGDGVSNSLSATISITNRPVDDPPTVVAGPNQLIILPANSVNLAGSVIYDVFPGAVDTVVWSKVSGPGNVTFSNPSNTLTTATFSQSGIYRLRLFASDSFLSGSNDLFVTVDAPPVVNAGPTMTNTFPGTIILPGSASDDGLPANGTLKVVWGKISGPGTVVFGNAAATNSTATFSTNGVYVLRLTADDSIATNHSDMKVIENLPPVVNAGASILTNGLQAALNGSVIDDGLPGALLSSQWSQSTGPGTITFSHASATNTTVTASQSGTYVLVLTAYDGAATNSSEVVVTFNLPPVVNAGPAQTVNFGTTATLAGTITDDQLPYNILTSTWNEVSGPGNATFADTSVTNTTVTFDQPGTYTLRLTASDTLATTNADVVIRVNAAPVVDSGTDQLVTLGTWVTLAGSYTDDGIPGSVVTTLWTQISGPAGAVFADPTTANTTVNFSQSGVYVFQLTANDGLTNGSARVTVIVNQAPTVSVTADKFTVEMPDTVTLNGIVSDDGLPKGTLTCLWNQVGGPGKATFSNPAGTNTTVSFNAAGTYILSLTANDSVATGSNHIILTVLPTNQPPLANSQTLSVAGNTTLKIILTGSDPEGSSLTYTLLSQPTHGTLNLQPLTLNKYVYTPAMDYNGPDSFAFKVNDGRSDSAPATVTINVQADTSALQLNVPGEQTIPHNIPLVFGLNRLISIVDEDAGLGVLELSLSVSNGTLTLGPADGLEWQAGANGTSNQVVRGTLGDLNAALAGLSYLNFTNFSGVDLLNVTVDDLGNTDPGMNFKDAKTILITVIAPPNNPPKVSIVAPADTSQFQFGQTITVEATATDWDGQVNHVTLLADGRELAELTAPPFATAWTNATLGRHVLSAMATDDQGDTSASSDVVLWVVDENGGFMVEAGPDQIISLPNAASLAGTVEIQMPVTDSQTNVTWSRLDGPGDVQFLDPNVLITTAQFSKPGSYTFKLQVAYAGGIRSDLLKVEVLPAPPDRLTAARSSRGTDFWLTFLNNAMPIYEPQYFGNDLYISADVDTAGKADFFDGRNTEQRFQIHAGSTTIVPAWEWDLNVSDSIQTKAIHVTTDHPVTVHGLNYVDMSTDGYLALPTAMLGTDYIVLSYRNSPYWDDPAYIMGGTQFALVASENDTTITIIPSVTVDSRIAGVPYQIVLQTGETYRLINYDGPDADLTGTTIKSDKPIAVFGGHMCALVPPSVAAGDHLVEQLPPVNMWGRHFVTLPLATRTKGDTFRFLAATNGTRVAINGKMVASLDRGQFLERIIDAPAEILASKPILVAQYANGSDFDGSTGDPSMMLVLSVEQFGGDCMLSTPSFWDWPDEQTEDIYTDYLNLIIRTNGMGRIQLDGVCVPASQFQIISNSGYAGAQLPINPGNHHLSAPVPFGACIYGWAWYESYAFGAGFYSETVESDTKLELTQPTPFAAVDHEKTVMARVTNGRGLPIHDMEVSFSVSGANVATGRATTSRLGRAVFSYAGANAGVDVITARLMDLEQSVTNTWVADSDNTPPVVSTADTPPLQFSLTIQLVGTAADDGRPAGGGLHTQWLLLDGPADVQFENATQSLTRAFCSESGRYQIEFSAADTQFSSHALVEVIVDDPPGMAFPGDSSGLPSLAPVGSPIQLAVNAWDDDGEIDRVEFYANDSLIDTATNGNSWTSYSINWTPSSNGWFQIRAVAFDNLGGSNSLDFGTIQVDCVPQVLIDSPGSGIVLTVPTNVLVHATASDPDGTIVSLSIYANGDLLGTSDGPDVAATWFPRQEGDYTLTAIATDDLGLTTSESVSVTVTGDFPHVALIHNTTNAYGQSYIAVPIGVPTCLAADVWMPGPYHITNVTFHVGSVWGGQSDTAVSSSKPPYQILWTDQDAGFYSITVIAGADSGAIGETSEWVSSYRKVSIAFAAPAANKPVAVGMPVAIQLSVDDPGHLLETFDYHVNGQLLVETTNSDAVLWQPPSPGNYQLSAQAIDRIYGTRSPFNTETLSVNANFAFINDGVSIVSPDDGDSLFVGSPTPIYLAFEDPTGGFDHAEIFTNGVGLGQTTNSWLDWVPQQTNDYSLTAVAYDHQGNASPPSDPVMVHVLTPPPPQVVITSPSEGTRLALGQETIIAVDVTDPAQAVTNLELLVAGNKVADSLDSYIPWTPASTGSHTLAVVAADWNGNRVASAPVNVTVVEMHPPTVTVTSPADGIHFTAETLPPLGAAASDSDGTVTNLTLELDGTMLGETNGTTLELSATNILGGWHTVLARATDNDGLVGSSSAVSFFIERSEDASLPVPDQFMAETVSAAEIRLGWQSLPTNTPASSVLVERWSPDLSAWIEIGRVPAAETNYADPSLNPETNYRYRAATTDNKVHRSAYSAEAQATTRTVVPNYSVIDLTEALVASLTGRGAGANILTNSGLNHFDSRRTVPLDASHAGSVLGTNATTLKLAVARFKEQWPQIQLDYDPVLLSPKSILPRLGYLTGPAGTGITVSDATAQMFDLNDPDRPVKAFLQEYQTLFGFGPEALSEAGVQRDYVSAGNSAHTVVWQQQVAGVPVFDALLIGHITSAGELACLSSEFIPSPAQAADPAMVALVQSGAGLPLSSPLAIVAAVTNIGDRFTAGYVVAQTDAAGVTRQQTFTATDGIKGDARAELTWFPASRTQLKLCWQVLFTSPWRDEMYLTLVSADTGEILYRRNLTTEGSEVTCRVYTNASPTPLLPGWPAPSTAQPSLVERGLVTWTAMDDTASPNGWIADGDNETRGNNVDAHLDRNDDNLADLPRPTGNPSRVFDFPLDLTTAPANYGEAATVQLFYWDNWMHDALYQLGFTEAAGNFQSDNFGRGGLGNDAVQADAQDGLGLNDSRHANNANMSTPPDGCAPRMQMYVFDGASPARDGSLDAQIVLHEYTHGLSTRLVGGGAGIDALQTAGMGEGWSDFYALTLLTDPAADVDGVYPMGSYVAYHGFGTTFEENNYYGIRRYPYCTDTNKNPLTFADIDPWKASAHDGVPRNPLLGPFHADLANEVHSQGEVWCMMLWEMRANLNRKLGPEAGNNLALQLVTDGLKLSPPNPNFVQARDAILLADRMWSGGANAPEIWSAFAKRGLGFNAKAPESYTTSGAQESRDLMPALAAEQVEVQTASGAVELGVNNNLLIHLRNQGDTTATHVSGRLATAMPGVAVLQNLSTYSDIPQGGSRANDAVFQIQTGTGFVEGTSIDLAFVITSDQSAGTNYLRLFTGVPGVEILFDNYSALADPATDSSVTKDLTPMDLGNLEPLWMADDASCLLTIGPGKYLLWRLNAEPVQMLNDRFLAHRLTRNGMVVGRMEAALTFDIFGNRLSHTYGAKWVPDEKNPMALTLNGNGYRFPKGCPLYANVGSAYDLTIPPPNWLDFVADYPTLQDVWDMDSGGQAVGAASVYVQPHDANGDGIISRTELEFSLTERHEFAADGTLNWLTVTERGANAGYNNTAVMQINYNAMLTSAAQFDSIGGWRWLGPLNSGLGGSLFSTALLANDAGTIAGYGAAFTGNPTVDALIPTHAFRLSDSREFIGTVPILQDLGVVSGGLYSFPRAINRLGQLVGYSQYQPAGSAPDFHGVFWDVTDVAPQDLRSLMQVKPEAPPAGFSDAYAINDHEQIVGTSHRPSDGASAAVLWQYNHDTNGTPFWEITDLNRRLTDDSWYALNAVGINDDGLILAHALKTIRDRLGNVKTEEHSALLVTAQLAVDANRDGGITFDDADLTTQNQPYRFWLNDDMDESESSSLFGEDEPEVYPPSRPDSGDRVINSPRDCEDLTRLWLDAGNLVDYLKDAANDFYIGLKWENVGDTKPAIRLFRSADPSGGLGHIKDATIASKQASDFSSCLVDADFISTGIDQVKPTDRLADFIFTKHTFAGLDKSQSKLFLLFEGVSEGKGELRLVFLKKNSDGSWQSMGEGPGVWLDLKNIRRMYVRAYSTPLPENFPLPWQEAACKNPPAFPYQTNWMTGSLYIPVENLGYGIGDSTPSDENQAQYPFDAPPDEQKKCVVFVHGIDLTVAEQQGYAQSFYKRLWWEGYRGRLVTFRWATTLDEGLGTFKPNHENTSIFNSGEYRSWYGGASLRQYVADLRAQLGDNEIISVAAHSLGNACVGGALRQGMQVNSYVAMEAAVSLSCYYPEIEDPDEHMPTDQSLINADAASPTPCYASQLGYQGYLSDIGNNAVNRTSYYNADDFWLATGHTKLTKGNWPVDWITSQQKYKPDDRYGLGEYKYESQFGLPRQPSFERGLNYIRSVSDPFEVMAFIARSRTRPLGAGEPPQKFSGLDLKTVYKFDPERSCHSGQFQRNIQLMYADKNGKQWLEPFYHRLMNDLHVGP